MKVKVGNSRTQRQVPYFAANIIICSVHISVRARSPCLPFGKQPIKTMSLDLFLPEMLSLFPCLAKYSVSRQAFDNPSRE